MVLPISESSMNRTRCTGRDGIGRNHHHIFSSAVANAHSGTPAQWSIRRIASTLKLVAFMSFWGLCKTGYEVPQVATLGSVRFLAKLHLTVIFFRRAGRPTQLFNWKTGNGHSLLY